MTGRVIVIRVRVKEYDLDDERAVVLPTDQANGQQMTIPTDDILSFEDHETLPSGRVAPVRAAEPASA